MLLDKLERAIEGLMLRIGEKLIREDEGYSFVLDMAIMNGHLPKSKKLFKDIINEKLVVVPLLEMPEFKKKHYFKLSTLSLREVDGKFYYLVYLYD